MPASTSHTDHTELLSIGKVEVRTRMKRSNIYRSIQLGLFPAPIHLGGSKWDAAEVEEYIQRRKEERDRKFGTNKFVPRPGILSGQDAYDLNGSLPDRGLEASVVPPSFKPPSAEPGAVPGSQNVEGRHSRVVPGLRIMERLPGDYKGRALSAANKRNAKIQEALANLRAASPHILVAVFITVTETTAIVTVPSTHHRASVIPSSIHLLFPTKQADGLRN